MFKKVLLALCVLACVQFSYAQSLMHSFGATIAVMQGNLGSGGNKSSFSMSQTYFSYFPRYNFIENENSSVSIGAPIGLGFGIANNTYGDDAGFAFAYDIPVVADYNIGCNSTYDNEHRFGGYFGAGFSYNHVSISKSNYSDFKGSSYGPLFRGGIRLGSKRESWAGQGITVGMFYKKDLQSNPFNSWGFNVYYDL